MADMRHFSDFNGETIRLCRVTGMNNAPFQRKFPGVKGKKYDGYAMLVGEREGTLPVWCEVTKGWIREYYPVTRTIEYKKNPSKHKCDARCTNAKGFKCECSCNGKNHGAGNFACA
jgi:hypothetical protein